MAHDYPEACKTDKRKFCDLHKCAPRKHVDGFTNLCTFINAEILSAKRLGETPVQFLAFLRSVEKGRGLESTIDPGSMCCIASGDEQRRPRLVRRLEERGSGGD